jgi:tmRNA-binding protein
MKLELTPDEASVIFTIIEKYRETKLMLNDEQIDELDDDLNEEEVNDVCDKIEEFMSHF